MALVCAGCGTPTAPPPAAAMLGAWSYSSESVVGDPYSLNAGLHVDIAIESVDGGEFAGRVTRWVAGDVGISPDAFGPATGCIHGDDGVTLLIPRAARDGPTITIVGVLARDMLTVRASWLGADPGPFPTGSRFERPR